jgi:predicted TIM-barrel fold metal-dependent hydrolase
MMTLAEKAQRGLPLGNIPIIDAHNHLGRWNAFYVPDGGTIEQMIAKMDALGIDRVCVTAHSSIGPDYVYGNDMVLDAITRHPDRVIGYVTVNPNYPEDMRHELDRCFAHPGFRAVKLHPECHSREVDHKNYAPAYEEAQRRGCPVLIHVWGPAAVMAVDRLAPRYPDAKFIMAHTGGDAKTMELALGVINRHGNVYGDFAISTALEGNVEWFVREVGSKKVIFGTDMPFFDPAPCVARIAMADISDEEKLDIFSGNITSLMGL